MDPHATLEAGTFNLNALAYDSLVELDRDDHFVPALATAWTLVEPTRWRFTLRRGVTFQDGTPFTAADVVFSIERAQGKTSLLAGYAAALGQVTRIDDFTIELRQSQPDPMLLSQLSLVLIMSRAWCIAHQAEQPPDLRLGQNGYSNRQAMGTGRYRLESNEPGVRTLWVRNPTWWGRMAGNVERIVFLPVGSDATRTAALLSGDIDFTQDVPPQDIDWLAASPDLRLIEGTENRLIYLGMDQSSDTLIGSTGLGVNPFKDTRVREAFALAIDTDAIRTTIMHGRSQPTACFSVSAAGCLFPAARVHPPPDLARARRLLAEAGLADGFELTLDCPNDRYINDQPICVAVSAMLARIGVRAKVDARPKAQYFRKLDRSETGFYLHGYGYSPDDPVQLFMPLLHTTDVAGHLGSSNFGHIHDPELDRWIDAAFTEMDPSRRDAWVRDIQQRTFDRWYVLPLHRQVLTWASRRQVHPVITSNNIVRVDWIRIDP